MAEQVVDPAESDHTKDPFLPRMLTVLAAAVLAWIALSTTVSVVSRALGGNPYAWTLETSEYGLLFVTILPLAAVVSAGEQIQVTILNPEWTPRLVRLLDPIVEVVGAVLSFILFAAFAYVAYRSYLSGASVSGILRFPRWIILAPMAIASFFWFWAHARRVFNVLRGSREGQV